MKKILIVFCAAALLAVTGCTSMITMAPSSTPITSKDTYTKLGPTVGRAACVIILGVIPLGPQSPSRYARDNAIENKGGNALIEVTQEYNVMNLLVVQFSWTKVEGVAIKFERKGADIE
ncbi:MAG: hypothetical protein A2020_04330 [Lentisphaerae bacterium GWF2_45_14]|nr:MAG: hypothetical protein A2020_04330 [Lentisphaerae bacterium GWF2_45_14]